MSSIAFIPARSGSKEIIGKNTKKLNGVPLILYSLKSAFDSNFDYIVVSTDQFAIFNLCDTFAKRHYSGDARKLIWHQRPDDLALDDSQIDDAILHFYQRSNVRSSDVVVVLQPTSPIRLTCDINNAIDMLVSKRCSSLLSVCEAIQHPREMLVQVDGRNKFIMGVETVTQRQSYEQVFFINGSIYAYDMDEYLLNPRSVYDDSYLLPMSRWHSIDIDTMDDWLYAEFLLKTHIDSPFVTDVEYDNL